MNNNRKQLRDASANKDEQNVHIVATWSKKKL